MNQDIKAKWLEALRSGQYNQGQYTLCELSSGKPEHCCLGVLCEVLGLDHKDNSNTMERTYVFGSDYEMDSNLTIDLLEHVGLTAAVEADLVNMNDHCEKSFADIADYIEERL